MSRYDIDGVFVAHDGEREVNAEIRIHDGAVSITKADGSPIASTARVQAVHPAAIRYVDSVARELHRIAYTRPPKTAITEHVSRTSTDAT